jgi:2-oxoglutarate-Fe(II)-dependent oxygenase superfamily protein
LHASSTDTAISDELLDLRRFDAGDRVKLRREFDRAEPFPHLVLSEMLTVGPEILSTFPDTEWGGWLRFEDEYQPEKLYATDLAVVPEPFRRILIEMNSRSFLVFLEEVTGIKALVPDPYFEGGGLHSSGPGGVLRPHTDFHIYPRLRLYRQLNALLYLNPGWRREFGGLLEFYDDKSNRKVKEVVPDFGTMVVFRTDDQSVHGFSEPVRDGHRRNSIATYYYTSEEAAGFSGDYTTYWRTHTPSRGFGRVRFGLYRALLGLSRGFSLAAHMVNPHHGLRWLRTGLGARRRAATGTDRTQR